ncbi:hypothetical protein CHS0354_000169 [Potamilus streckersoni]|uniref:Uncharacterized protein n=1 Tax=Potamilus streckersoni TaxID=2493646 RepID=A0AAE0S6V6_9BIVA|nr:hypothetical protein CHS0354_000169 [Potamilus streckersoni]
MSTHAPNFTPWKKYNENHWSFSRCSVASFQKTLRNKQCAYTKYVHPFEIYDEFRKILIKQPGERYTLNEQCHIIKGPGSVYCGKVINKLNSEVYCVIDYPLSSPFKLCTDP